MTKGAFDSVKAYLQTLYPTPLNDTLIIKYEFANETCWDMLDRQSDEYIGKVIAQSQNFIKRQKEERKNVSIFRLKESGGGYNTNVDRDNTIQTDDGTLRRLLFAKRTVCGTSAIVLPSGHYVLVKSDSHFTALYQTNKHLQVALK